MFRFPEKIRAAKLTQELKEKIFVYQQGEVKCAEKKMYGLKPNDVPIAQEHLAVHINEEVERASRVCRLHILNSGTVAFESRLLRKNQRNKLTKKITQLINCQQ
jgi:hypothetical protein